MRSIPSSHHHSVNLKTLKGATGSSITVQPPDSYNNMTFSSPAQLTHFSPCGLARLNKALLL